MVGCLGGDLFEPMIRRVFDEAGVDTGYVRTVPGVATGVAHIRVDASGDNDIVIVPNANAHLRPADLDHFFTTSGLSSSVLLLQLEAPADTTVYAAKVGHQRGLTVILDPAPAQDLPEDAARPARTTPSRVGCR